MVDRLFSDARLAELYDLFCPWGERGDFDFYLDYAMAADSVLDVGCGTGLWLRGLRRRGHTGRLVGLDPAAAMLAVARRETDDDIVWLDGDLESVPFEADFDLVVMTGHAFQVLLSDEEVRSALESMRAALQSSPAGRVAFETRNPTWRAWESWTPANSTEVVDGTGAKYRLHSEVEEVTDEPKLVSFISRYTSPAWAGEEVSRSTLRFLSVDQLDELVSAAGLVVEERFGDWDRTPLEDSSPEIITVARAA